MTRGNRTLDDDHTPKCMATYRHSSVALSYCTKPPHPGDPVHAAHDAGGNYLFGWNDADSYRGGGDLYDPRD